MSDRTSMSRDLAEEVLKRAAALEQAEAAARDEGYSAKEIRVAAAEVGLQPHILSQAAEELLRQKAGRSQRLMLAYAGGTGLVAAIAAGGLAASGQLFLAVPFVAIDLLLAVRVVGIMQANARAQELPLRALADAEPPNEGQPLG